MRAVLAFAKSSLWAAALCLGASVWLASALVGSSMISLGHLVGSAVTCVALLGLAARGELASITYRPSRNHFAVLFAAVTAAWVAQGWAYYWSGVFAVWDIGIYADLLANLALRGSYYSHILKRHGFADHVTPSLTLLAPLFALKPTFLWLVAAKVCAALACSWLLWLLGREVLGRESRWLYALPMLCLMHTVLTYGYTFQFQPSVLAAPLSLVCFWLAIKERWMLLAAALLFTFGLREDQPLIGVCVGLFVWLERGHTRLGLSIVAASIVVGVVGFWGIAPAFAEGRFFQHGRFGPWVLWPEKARLYVVLLATVGALPLLRPRTLLWCTPILAVHFLSRMSGMQGFRHHYQVVPVVVFLVAALHGLAALEARRTWLDAQAPKRRALAIAGSLGLMVSLNACCRTTAHACFGPPKRRVRPSQSCGPFARDCRRTACFTPATSSSRTWSRIRSSAPSG
jgi:hypothetical protein